jgi:hypothetical protein
VRPARAELDTHLETCPFRPEAQQIRKREQKKEMSTRVARLELVTIAFFPLYQVVV